MLRRYWLNFQCWGILLVWVVVGQWPIALVVGSDGGCSDIFLSSICFLSPSPSLGDGPI